MSLWYTFQRHVWTERKYDYHTKKHVDQVLLEPRIFGDSSFCNLEVEQLVQVSHYTYRLIPYPFLGYLVLWLGSAIWKNRYPQNRGRV